MDPATITLRPAAPADEAFLREVYASTRFEELAPLGWSMPQQMAFLTQQFDAQHYHYHTYYPDARYDVVLIDGQRAGRLYVADLPNEIVLMDIALLPEYRGKGIGTRLLTGVLGTATTAGKPLTLHVEKFNRALGLYARFGFNIVDEYGVYWLMEYRPGQQRAAGDEAEKRAGSQA